MDFALAKSIARLGGVAETFHPRTKEFRVAIGYFKRTRTRLRASLKTQTAQVILYNPYNFRLNSFYQQIDPSSFDFNRLLYVCNSIVKIYQPVRITLNPITILS